ncbi:circadian clock KaiB family protein [Oscillatoria sp. CS-180]|nr:circadian clock KaiB family protein [Oscillatoria sp. CS-180]MDB9528938.1 circadian clock KaiB family protein [Oscillatoria sp. CS-180]
MDSPLVSSAIPRPFKGIAVFTPGGDLVYCRDYQKKTQWHLNLCGALQEHLGLVESPHFLVPYFTATIDCWRDPSHQNVQIVAEAYPLVYRYQGLLNAVFELGDLEWQRVMPSPEYRSLSVFETHRSHFPQLWESHNLVLDLSDLASELTSATPDRTAVKSSPGTVLKLFVSGHSALTEQILKTLQGVLESSRYRPYTLQMVDVSKHPEQAEIDQISATPTLIRISPKPVRRLVGELHDPRALLSLLSDS